MLQTAVLHVQSAQREEAQAGDILAAILQQPKTHAAQLLAEQGVTRLDILELHLARHLEDAGGRRAGRRRDAGAQAGGGDEGPATRARSAGGVLREPDRARARRGCSIR